MPNNMHITRCTRLAASAVALWLGFGATAYGESKSTPPRYEFCSGWIDKTASLSREFTTAFLGEDEWIFFSTDFSALPTPRDRDVLAVKQLVDVLAAKGTRLVIVVPPLRGIVEDAHAGPYRRKYLLEDQQSLRNSHRRALAALARTGAIVPDLLKAADAAKLPASVDFYRKQDNHWHSAGARISAAAVAAEIAARVDLSKLPKQAHASRITAQGPYRTLVVDKLAEICGPKFIARDQEPTYVTEPVGESAGGGDLLGGSATSIVLAGTSFSRPDGQYNFGGFLAEALGLDVLNVAIPGGGLVTSILSYLGSEDFSSAPPAVLVWEVRPFELPDEKFVGELLATIAGTCPTEQALLKQDSKLQRGMTEVMAFTPEQRSKLRAPLFVDVAIGETGINKYLLRMNYSDFTNEDVEVDLTRAAFPPGHFFHALTAAQLGKLESILLRPAARLNGSVTVSLCPARRAS